MKRPFPFRSPHAWVGGWAFGLLLLAFMLLGFQQTHTPSLSLGPLLYFAMISFVAGFGIVAAIAVHRGREHAQQLRQPRRAGAAVFFALALAIATTGLAYGWVIPFVGIIPLGVSIWMFGGERLPRGARPSPVARDGVEPASPDRYPYEGQVAGRSEPVPPAHPAHAPAPPAPPPEHVSAAAKAGWTVIVLRAARRLVKGRR